MKHSVSHDLGRDLAKKATEAAFAAYQEKFPKYQPTARWTNEHHADISFTAKGVKLSGSIDVNPDSIEMDLDVPFLLRPFKKQAMGVIEKEIQKWVEKARAGEV